MRHGFCVDAVCGLYTLSAQYPPPSCLLRPSPLPPLPVLLLLSPCPYCLCPVNVTPQRSRNDRHLRLRCLFLKQDYLRHDQGLRGAARQRLHQVGSSEFCLRGVTVQLTRPSVAAMNCLVSLFFFTRLLSFVEFLVEPGVAILPPPPGSGAYASICIAPWSEHVMAR